MMTLVAAAWYKSAIVQFILAWAMIIFCLLLIGVILLQKGRGGGLAGAFGGAGGFGSAFGAKTGDFLTWVTVVCALVYMLLGVVGNYAFDTSGTTRDTTLNLGADQGATEEDAAEDMDIDFEPLPPSADEKDETTPLEESTEEKSEEAAKPGDEKPEGAAEPSGAADEPETENQASETPSPESAVPAPEPGGSQTPTDEPDASKTPAEDQNTSETPKEDENG